MLFEVEKKKAVSIESGPNEIEALNTMFMPREFEEDS